MTDNKQKKNNNQIGMFVVLGVVAVSIFPWLFPIGIIGFVIYLVIKRGKFKKKTPLSAAQKSEYRTNPPKPRPKPRPQPSAPRPQPTASRPAPQHPAYDASRFVRVTTDYAARHRENAKRLFDAGLIERDEYNMQIARSRNL